MINQFMLNQFQVTIINFLTGLDTGELKCLPTNSEAGLLTSFRASLRPTAINL